MNKSKVAYSIIIALVFIFAICIRLYAYIQFRPLWHDECSLALSIIRYNFVGYFSSLENSQSAPPLFMMITKLITIFGGIKEGALRLLPLLSSLISIPLFYYLSRYFLCKKWVILFAVLLFGINTNLIYYAQEFKQYSTDVLVFIFLFISAIKFDFLKVSNTKSFFAGSIAALFPMLSFPSIFIILSVLTYKLVRFKKEILCKIGLFIVPLTALLFIYLFTTILPQHSGQVGLYKNYWEQGFLTFNLMNVLNIIKINLLYYFTPNQNVLFILIMLIIGFCIIFKFHRKKQNSILLLTVMFIIISSFLKLYPIFQRVSLYILPILIIMFVKPLELFSFKNKVRTLLIMSLFILSIYKYNVNYFKNLIPNVLSTNYDARAITQILKQKYDSNDYIISNNASDSEFGYYSVYSNLQTNKFFVLVMPKYDKQDYINILNSLPHGNYWFYCAYDYSHSPIIPYLKEWSLDKNVLYSINKKYSYLLYVKL